MSGLLNRILWLCALVLSGPVGLILWLFTLLFFVLIIPVLFLWFLSLAGDAHRGEPQSRAPRVGKYRIVLTYWLLSVVMITLNSAIAEAGGYSVNFGYFIYAPQVYDYAFYHEDSLRSRYASDTPCPLSPQPGGGCSPENDAAQKAAVPEQLRMYDSLNRKFWAQTGEGALLWLIGSTPLLIGAILFLGILDAWSEYRMRRRDRSAESDAGASDVSTVTD